MPFNFNRKFNRIFVLEKADDTEVLQEETSLD
jgi:hypothetical protein